MKAHSKNDQITEELPMLIKCLRYAFIVPTFCLLLVLSAAQSGLCSPQSLLVSIPQLKLDAGAVKVADYPQRKNVVRITAVATLSQADTEYILENDVVANSTAFSIAADNITLNLNGHTVVYDQKNGNSSAYGVLLTGWTRRDIAVVNGTIIQGEGNTPGKLVNEYGMGSNPVCGMSVERFIVAGLSIKYQSRDTSGIYAMGSGIQIYHNTIEDRGSEITNRHQGTATIEGRASAGMLVHHNMIVRSRHIGIRSGKDSQIYNNDITIDSWNTNSVGIAGDAGARHSNGGSARIHHNRIMGRGIHPIGIWPGSDCEVYDNYVDVQNTRSGSEYGDTGSACFRILWATNVRAYNNHFYLHAEENYNNTGVKSWGRAIWIGLPDKSLKVTIENNTIVALNSDGKAKAAAIGVVYRNESPDLIFRRNTVISNWSNVLLADTYGHADGFARFIDNRFIRSGNHAGYRTIRSQYASRPSTGVFINNEFENGASPESIDIEFYGEALKELAFGWHLNVAITDAGKALAAAQIRIVDKAGVTVYEGVSDQQGKVAVELVSYLRTNQAGMKVAKNGVDKRNEKGIRVDKTPHTIYVTSGERTIEKIFSLLGNTDIAITF